MPPLWGFRDRFLARRHQHLGRKPPPKTPVSTPGQRLTPCWKCSRRVTSSPSCSMASKSDKSPSMTSCREEKRSDEEVSPLPSDSRKALLISRLPFFQIVATTTEIGSSECSGPISACRCINGFEKLRYTVIMTFARSLPRRSAAWHPPHRGLAAIGFPPDRSGMAPCQKDAQKCQPLSRTSRVMARCAAIEPPVRERRSFREAPGRSTAGAAIPTPSRGGHQREPIDAPKPGTVPRSRAGFTRTG